MTAHPRLMSPIALRGHTLRNRIVFGARTANMSDQGLPGPRFGGYLPERAHGVAAMIAADPMPVHRSGVLTSGNFLRSSDQVIPHFRATADPMVGKELTRTAADGPIRRALARLSVTTRTEHCIARWHGNGAKLRNLLTGGEETLPASALVMATTNIAFDPFPETLAGKTLHRIGDCAAPRLAAYAFHEGRKLALAL